MARRSSRIQEVSEKSEVSCMWGLFSILESCQGRPSQKVISYGRPLNRHILGIIPFFISILSSSLTQMKYDC